MRTMGAVGALSMLNLLQVALLPTEKEINDDYAQVKKARESLMNLFMQPEVTSPPGRGAIELDTFVIADHLRKFDESDLSLSMDATLLTSWTDQRISWEPRDFGNINEIAVTGYDINLFWVPPVEIKSILPIRKTIMTPYNTELMIKHDGTVLAASKISVKMACESDLENYPYDKPSCSLYLTYRYFESQNYTFGDKHIFMDRETVAGWNNMTVHAAYNVVNMTATRYYVTGLGVTTDYVKYKKGEPVTKAIGTFVQYQFQIERNHGYYIHHVLLPLYCGTLLSLVGASLINFYNSMMILLFALLYLIITLARIAANLPPNYEITPYCMTYGTMIFAEVVFFIGYKIGLALYLRKTTLKGEEMSKIQLAERLFRYYLFLHALLSYYLLFF